MDSYQPPSWRSLTRVLKILMQQIVLAFVTYQKKWFKFWQLILLTLCGDFCYLLTTFANSLDPDHNRQNVVLDLNLKKVFLKIFMKKLILSKFPSSDNKTKHAKSQHQITRNTKSSENISGKTYAYKPHSCPVYGIWMLQIIHIHVDLL